MPELPEVETTRRGMLPLLNHTVSQVAVRNPALRWPVPANLSELLTGQPLLSLARRAKYILAQFPNGYLLLHLGMSGRLCLLASDEAPGKHDHVDLHFTSGQMLRLRDPRRFGAVLWAGLAPAEHMLIRSLGLEPLDAEFNGSWLYQQLRNKTAPIKNVIMDSHLVVGVGNIYASESLFRAGIHPNTSACRISQQRCVTLVHEIKSTLEDALKAGGSSLRDFFGADGNPGYFQQEYYVYGRTGEPCKRCGALIKSIRLGQRSTFFCGQCQR
jgi:formamidopyrimidine-DNA glycosylase